MRASLPKADPKTWRRIAGDYSTDGARVYYGNRVVSGADPDTFQAFATLTDHFVLASDKNRHDRQDAPISRAERERKRS